MCEGDSKRDGALLSSAGAAETGTAGREEADFVAEEEDDIDEREGIGGSAGNEGNEGTEGMDDADGAIFEEEGDEIAVAVDAAFVDAAITAIF